MLKKIMLSMIIILMAGSALASAWEYTPGIEPHTRYNPLRYGCYYYYGYGSCKVDNEHCRGVSIGRNKWVNLGDACNRNDPPKLTGLKDMTITETEKLVIRAECKDQDPAEISYSGWTESAEKLSSYDDAGEYIITIKCTDSFGETDTDEIKLTIKDKNRAPLFRAIGYEIE